MPIIDPHYLETEHDRRTLRKAMQLARIIGGQPELSEWSHHELLPGEVVASDPDLDAFLARAAATHHHPAGTCRMGDVVDETLGVRGVADLFIADASVIPRLPSGPINAAVMAIAETWSTLSSSL